MKQNIYDEKNFYNSYEQLRSEQKGLNANDLIEIPTFRKLVPDVKNKSILDLGCGAGENDKYYKLLGAKKVLGTDISEKMIENANKNNKISGVKYKVIPMEDINTLNEKFDIIISSLAFHYVKDFDTLIKNCYDLLNDGGYLVFSEEHPFTTCTKYTENVTEGHTIIDNKYFGIFSDYNIPGERIRNWFGEKVYKYHRNFEEIVNTLIKHGFIIEKILEPAATEEIVKKNPKYINQNDRPFFLFVRAKKI